MATIIEAADADAAVTGECEQVARFTIWPYRSMSCWGIISVIVLAAAGAAAIVLQAPAPARLPLAFGGLLMVAGLALAFWQNCRAGRITETVEIGPRVVRVTRAGERIADCTTEFSTAWLRIILTDDRYVERRLVLTESGKSVSIGQFLSPGEREALASALTSRIAHARQL